MREISKRILSLMMTLPLCLLLVTGCGTAPAATSSQEPAPSSTPNAEEGKKVLLAVSFGTSYNDNRELTIGGIEKSLQAAYPDYEVRRAFTSQIIIDKLKSRDNLEIDNVTQAMDRLVADGVKEVVIQPTHVMTGYEYDDVVKEVTPYSEKFDKFVMGTALLTAEEDYKELASIIAEETKSHNVDGTAIVFMGHGTEHEANATYTKLQKALTDAGHKNYFVGTVEAEPTLEEVMAMVKANGAKKVVLLPLMIVAGDHANNDMAGDEDDSWKSAFKAAGYEVECVLTGLGQYTGVQKMFVKHAGALMTK